MAATLCFLQQNAAKDVETSKETSKTAPSFPQLTTTKNTSTLKPAPPSILVKSVPTTSIQPTSRSIIPPPPPKARPTSTVPVSSAKPTLPASPKSLLSQQPSPTLPTQSPPPTSPRLKPKPALSETPTPTVTSHSATVCSDLACANCGVTSTPLWRRGLNDDVLCNACGLYLKLHHVNRPKTLRPTSKKDTEGLPSVECHNCMTKNTPLWRRDDEGRPLCNACGL
ncbi:hypothetical protein BC829DRAFT_361008 [Chytridium lagenaria]|nr:hypothetical protein BC829DRAFT_361008 [Chytridium lagenaria]